MRKAALLVVLLAAACYVGQSRYHSPPPERQAPPPAPAKRMLTQAEAVNVATGYARSNGLQVNRVKHAHLDGAGRWHVDLRGDRGKDKAKVLVDAWTGQVIKASLKDED
jgi:hypothetical protein